MEKNTHLLPLPAEGKRAGKTNTGMKNQKGPSLQILQNILNYSKALKIQESTNAVDFIEYIAN